DRQKIVAEREDSEQKSKDRIEPDQENGMRRHGHEIANATFESLPHVGNCDLADDRHFSRRLERHDDILVRHNRSPLLASTTSQKPGTGYPLSESGHAPASHPPSQNSTTRALRCRWSCQSNACALSCFLPHYE